MKQTHRYDDIIGSERPLSRKAKMSVHDRAAQFSPFAALTGFDAAIEETARLTDNRMELDEGGKQLLDEQMNAVLEVIHTRPLTEILWFRYDERKAGGSYVTTTGHVKKIDGYTGKILMTDGQIIPLGEVFSVELLK